MSMKNDQTKKSPDTSDPLKLGMSSDDLVAMLNRRVGASKDHWNSKLKLDKRTKENEKLYLNEQEDDEEDDEDRGDDNRIFSSIRTIVPYVTTRVTEPQVYPSSKAESAKRFAEDIEKALFIHAENEKVKDKVKFSLEDSIIRRRGYLKPRYDAVMKNFCAVEFVPAESIIIDHKTKPYEEPRYFRHLLDKTIQDLLTMFPDMKDAIYTKFNLTDSSPKEDFEKPLVVNEDWLMVPDEKEGLDIVVCIHYDSMYLGGFRDPNWRYGKDNFLDHHMMPLVFFNVLSDGRGYIDKTSFVEQAKYLQRNVNNRSRQISKNAGLGNIGMPVVDSAALADDQSQYLTFEPDTVLELDVTNSGGTSIHDIFDVWKAGTLPNFVYEDKLDSRNAIDNTFGTPNVFRGEQSTNNTLGQDVLVRDQAFGRQQEIVDVIDAAMGRLYLLMAQFLLVYGGQPGTGEEAGDSDAEYESFEFMGEDGEFDYIMINTKELDTKIKIRVKSGTSMPIDRAQRRATADKAASSQMIDPLTYWEIMDESNAQKIAKRVMDFQTDPASFLKDTQEEVFNRDAFTDIQKIKNGKQPDFREDLPKEYFDYLNYYVISGNLENPTTDPTVKQAISQFIDIQLARGQKMLGMATTQLPTAGDITAANQQTDQLNQTDAQNAALQAKGQPQGASPQPTQPVQQPVMA